MNKPNKITATDLARSLSDVLNRVHYRGESFVVERSGTPVALIGPPAGSPPLLLGEALDRIGDLPLPGDGFADDLEAIQASQSSSTPPRDN